MKITVAEFWAAASSPSEIPVSRRPEVAVAGRSNVGKSSLINRMTRRNKLARTSQTPGCTRGLIFFNINDRMTLVDLPGYGWAQRSRSERAGWKRLVEGYLAERESLAGVLILVDVRRGPEAEERDLAAYLDEHEVEYAWVVTKCDKVKRAKLALRLRELAEEFGDHDAIATSTQTGSGVGDVWAWIDQAIGAHRGHGA